MKKSNDYERSRREIMNRSGSRNSRLRRQDVRAQDERNAKRYGECPVNFSAYVEKRLSEYKAPLMDRLGGAVKAGLNSFKLSGQKTFSMPSNAGPAGDDDFHSQELDMRDIADLSSRIRNPEIRKAMQEFSKKVAVWVYQKNR